MVHEDWINYTEGDLLDLQRKSPADFIDEIKMDYIKPYLPTRGTVVEVGAGSGRLLTRIGEYSNLNVVGIDYSPHSTNIIYKNINKFGLNGSAVRGDAIEIPLKTNSVNVVLSGGLLEHFALVDSYNILKEMNRVLIVGGLLYADIVPKKRTLCRPRLTHDVGGYENSISKHGWQSLINNAGFVGDVFSGLILPPNFYGRWASDKRINLIYKHKGTIMSLDNTWLSDRFGFVYFVIARKLKQ